MKKLSLIYLLVIFFGSCTINKHLDPTLLPAITNTGANTFGCLVDNWVVVGGRYYDIGFYGDGGSINFYYYELSNYIDVRVKIDEEPNRYFEFRINNVIKDAPLPQKCTFENARISGISLDVSGDVTVTYLNDSAQIISGTFFGTRITEGRFDVNYRQINF